MVLADRTKIGQETMCGTVATSEIDVLITDAGAPEEELTRLRDSGVEVIVSDLDTPPTAANSRR